MFIYLPRRQLLHYRTQRFLHLSFRSYFPSLIPFSTYSSSSSSNRRLIFLNSKSLPFLYSSTSCFNMPSGITQNTLNSFFAPKHASSKSSQKNKQATFDGFDKKNKSSSIAPLSSKTDESNNKLQEKNNNTSSSDSENQSPSISPSSEVTSTKSPSKTKKKSPVSSPKKSSRKRVIIEDEEEESDGGKIDENEKSIENKENTNNNDNEKVENPTPSSSTPDQTDNETENPPKSPSSSDPPKKKIKLQSDSPKKSKQLTFDMATTNQSATKSKASSPFVSNDSNTKEEGKESPVPIAQIQKEASSIEPVKPLEDGSLPYGFVVDTFEKIEATSSRLKIVAFAAELFLEVLRINPSELTNVVYLCINRLGPDYEGLELGLGESLVIKSLAESTGRTLAQIKNDYKEVGDLGLVALKSRRNQPTMFQPKPLSVSSVFSGFSEIAHMSGKDSQTRKISVIKRLLTSSKGAQAKYIVRSLEGKLRIGLAEKSVLSALAQAFVAWENEKQNETNNTKRKASPTDVSKAEDLFRDIHCQVPNYGVIIEAAIAGGIESISESCKLSAGIPLKPMLAKPTKSITEILDRFSGEEFTCEYKYDGERAQVHQTSDGKLHVYSRNMEDMSQRYPDILSSIAQFANKENTQSYILDCEAVAWDREQGKLLPFQVLSTRKRKDVDEDKITVRICLFAFDLLYLNGESVLSKTLNERRELLHQHFTPLEGHFAFAKSLNSDNVEDIQTFLDQSVKDSCEGLMIKVLKGTESGYEPSKRSRNWLKLKKDYLPGVGDSLDLVVLGAYYGKGKRTNNYGAFLLGCYNSDSEQYETICKIGTGFSDEVLETVFKSLSQTVIQKPKGYYSYDTASNTQPDVWFEPTMVWEVLTADLSLSPVYKAGIDTLGKGISLRFPRFIRIREDKGVEDVTTSDQVVEFYKRQASITNPDGKGDSEDE